MRKRASRIYNEPTGSFFTIALLVTGAAVAAYYYGNTQGAATASMGSIRRRTPFWNLDGTVNPVASLYSGNQLFNQWYGQG